MTEVSVFAFQDYKAYLRARLKSAESWGSITSLAQAAGCQRSYLSQVLNAHVHLTPDHAYGIADYWKLSDPERDYFLTLVEHARAASPTFRKHLERKLGALKRDQEDLSKRLQRPRVEVGEKEQTYYSAWYWVAIHVLVSIPEFQNPRAIAQHLQLPEALVLDVLERLSRFELIRREGNRWVHASGSLHIPKHSPLVAVHHSNWRQRASLSSQIPEEGNVHYTVVQSMSRRAFEEIKQKLLALIEESAAVAGPSKEEELVCMTCDLFRV